MTHPTSSDTGSATTRALGWTAMVLVLVAALVPIAALTFALRVTGHSMDPTLAEGDRVFADLRQSEIERFDLVEANIRGQRVVKRVIGLPGDRVSLGEVRGDAPTVLLRPAGTQTTMVVDNPTWTGRVGDKKAACCEADGTESPKRTWSTVPEGSYWVIGDNWGGSDDSRVFGFVSRTDIAATLNYRVLPIDSMGKVDNPARLVPRAS